MNFKKAASAALAAAMTMSAAAPTAIAAEVTATVGADVPAEPDATLGDQSTAEEPVAQGSSTVQKDHQSVKVYASANGSYVLRVPESINLHNTDKSDLGSGIYKNDTDCQITLRGDVRQDQKITVTVTNPTMQSEGCEDKPANVDVSSKTVWNRDDLFAGAAQDDGSYSEPTGTSTVYPVSAELTPGDWVGTATFNCTLSTDASAGGGSGSTGGTEDPAKKNLIPAGAVYTQTNKGNVLTGDGATVKFPEKPARYDTYAEGDYTYTYDFGWKEVTVNDKTKTAYGPIRSNIGGEDVTSLQFTFKGCANMTEAPTIPDTVTDMYYAFNGCTSLVTAPTIPANVTNMRGTFDGCKSLVTAPAIPEGVTNMFATFQRCTSLVTAPTIPANVTNMQSTFFNCESLNTYAGSTDPDGDFSNFKIPDGVTNMNGTFNFCQLLVTAPTIPDSVTSMMSTFDCCNSLKTYAGSTDPDGDFSKFKIPDGVTNMEGTFRSCRSLVTAPTIPANVTDMDGTFASCYGLTGTLICHANPTEYNRALYNTKITAIEGSCSEETKTALLATK